jgi:hypothetical protein
MADLFSVLPVQGQGGVMPYNSGSLLSPAQLKSTFFFKSSSSYCSGGPALLLDIDTWVGGPVDEGWFAEAPIPCQNCTQYEVFTVLRYADLRRLVVLYGMYGYDS